MVQSDVLDRPLHLTAVRRALRTFPVVAVLGARQVGKTTLAAAVAQSFAKSTRFDLEDPRDLERLKDPMLALESLRGLVIIDEVQRAPELFPALRALADRARTPARFLVLGSASPELLKQSSETLAGRISYHELPGFSLAEAGPDALERLWRRGGFPRSFLARSETASDDWRTQFVRTFLERDIQQLALAMPAPTLHRFWSMVAHYHGQTWNGSEIARAFGVADTTVRRWLDALTGTFMVRQLPAWFENIAKRQVRAPKIYLADSGLLHTLLGIRSQKELEAHPKVGASWEGFVLSEIIAQLRVDPRECYFWATHQGAELDLLVVRGQQRIGFEIKHTSTPTVTKSMGIALEELKLERLDVVYRGEKSYPLATNIRAIGLAQLGSTLKPFR